MPNSGFSVELDVALGEITGRLDSLGDKLDKLHRPPDSIRRLAASLTCQAGDNGVAIGGPEVGRQWSLVSIVIQVPDPFTAGTGGIQACVAVGNVQRRNPSEAITAGATLPYANTFANEQTRMLHGDILYVWIKSAPAGQVVNVAAVITEQEQA